MSFLAPGFIYAGLVAASVVVALHFIVTRQPRAALLPTARFVPDIPATAVTRSRRPTDVGLMVLRALLFVAAGAGLARPVFDETRVPVARIVLADVSRAVSDMPALRDALRGALRERDLLVVFDSATRTIGSNAVDSIDMLEVTTRRGNLSAALIAAVRAGSELRAHADSIELVVVSPFAAEEEDAATAAVRGLWPGGVRTVRAGIAREVAPLPEGRISVGGASDDPVAVTARLAGASARATIARDGSADAAASDVLVDWPLARRPRGAVERAPQDTSAGVAFGNRTVISSFPRRWSYPDDSIAGAVVMARWIDGEAAAVEWTTESGCLRSAAVPVTTVGDLAIRNDFVGFVESLAAPCAATRTYPPMSATSLAMLGGNPGFAPRAAFAPVEAQSWIAPWLVLLALVAGIMELILRRREGSR